jgi:hypothetical protein
MIQSKTIGFCNHCGAFDVPVFEREPISLCIPCWVADCKIRDDVESAFRRIRAAKS